MISFGCPSCQMQLTVKPEFAGRSSRCPTCKQPLTVPSLDMTQAYVPPQQTDGAESTPAKIGDERDGTLDNDLAGPRPTPVEKPQRPARAVMHEPRARIAFACTRCGMKFNVLADFAGRTTACPACKEALVVPSPGQLATCVPPAGQIDGPASSLARANVDAGVTLGGGATAGKSALPDLLAGKGGSGARYIIDKELARGGMGAILSAVDCDIRREVAVKYLLNQANPTNKLRFVEEAQITGQLEHPNIVPIHELGVDAQKRIFFTMKMVKGRSLAQILTRLRGEPAVAEKDYTLSRLLNIFLKVCDALAYAHSRGVVHRDLKPANIMVGDFGEVYVMDWGLAKVLNRTTSLDTGPPMATVVASFAGPVDADGLPLAIPLPPPATAVETPASSTTGVSFSAGSGNVVTSRQPEADLTQDGAIMGTPVYMPPEQATGNIQAIDPRSDVYALGAILYEMLTLHPPIDKDGGYPAVLMRVAKGAIVPPELREPQRARAGKIPRELAAVAMKALATNKEDRYQTIEAMRKDTELFLEGRSVSARQDTFREMAWKLAKRNKGASIATAAALVVLTVSAGFFLKINYAARVLAETERGKAEVAQSKSEVAQNKAEQAYQAYQGQLKSSVQLLLGLATTALNQRQFDDALVHASVAAKSAPDNADARLLKGKLLITRKRFAEAASELEEYRKLKGEDAGVQTLTDLCRKARPEDVASLLAFVDVFRQRQDHALADGVLRGDGKTIREARQRLFEKYRKQIETAWPGKGNNLTMSAEGWFSLRGLENATDLTPLKGIPLTTLDLAGNKGIRDLTPLKGMPLTSLNLAASQVRDLTPLKGMPLTSLNFHTCTQIQDLTPLKDMPLTVLNLHDGPKVVDLSPLKGMKLTELWLGGNPVRDLSPLKGMPLTTLVFSHCRQLVDLSPLRDLALTRLSVDDTSVRNLEPLKDMPLKNLYIDAPGVTDVRPLQTLQLEDIRLTPKNITGGLAILRAMKTLKTIGLSHYQAWPAAEFWARYDKGEFKK